MQISNILGFLLLLCAAFIIPEQEHSSSSSESRCHNVIIKAQVPLAEMLSYATDLTSKTQGRASYSREFSPYDYVPNELAGKSSPSTMPPTANNSSKKKSDKFPSSSIAQVPAGSPLVTTIFL